mmetsp:Transcript_11975/g.17729  ORF Transcript_11975/g.17729 Transcript_11975/m.17729 type:complete len:136 (+) Transcript_11975:182-589(+)
MSTPTKAKNDNNKEPDTVVPSENDNDSDEDDDLDDLLSFCPFSSPEATPKKDDKHVVISQPEELQDNSQSSFEKSGEFCIAGIRCYCCISGFVLSFWRAAGEKDAILRTFRTSRRSPSPIRIFFNVTNGPSFKTP